MTPETRRFLDFETLIIFVIFLSALVSVWFANSFTYPTLKSIEAVRVYNEAGNKIEPVYKGGKLVIHPGERVAVHAKVDLPEHASHKIVNYLIDNHDQRLILQEIAIDDVIMIKNGSLYFTEYRIPYDSPSGCEAKVVSYFEYNFIFTVISPLTKTVKIFEVPLCVESRISNESH